MTVAALRVELEREEILWGLTMMRRADSWERWELAEALVRTHLYHPTGMYVRMPLAMMPDWYRALWWDPTQIDGRAELRDIDQVYVLLDGVGPQGNPVNYRVRTIEFLDAVLLGAIGDAT